MSTREWVRPMYSGQNIKVFIHVVECMRIELMKICQSADVPWYIVNVPWYFFLWDVCLFPVFMYMYD